MDTNHSTQTPQAVSDKTKIEFSLGDIIKILGALAVIIPLVLSYMQYKQSVQESQDKNFREIVSDLSSQEKQSRVASASNIGTFINDDNPYYDEAINILVNMVPIESDIDVLQAIRSSLEKISAQEKKTVIQQLLKLDRNSFIYGAYLREKLKADTAVTEKEKSKYQELLTHIGKQDESLTENALKLELEEYKKRYQESMHRQKKLELVNSELSFRAELMSKFVTGFLSFTKQNPIEGIELFQNTWNYVQLIDLQLPKTIIKRSVLSSARIEGTDFSKSFIEHTSFFNSIISNTNFSGSIIQSTSFDKLWSLKNVSFKRAIFDDVFFTGSNMQGADFTGAKGLSPFFFYRTTNLKKAQFDDGFLTQLAEIDSITDEKFRNYVNGSSLSIQGQKELLETLDSLAAEEILVESTSHFKE